MKILSLQVGPIGTNCYIFCDEAGKVCGVVDPGGEPDRVAAAVESTGCVPAAILLTHGHYDHTGGVAGLREKYPQLPVYLNARDQFPDGSRKLLQLFPFLGNTTDYDDGDTVRLGGLAVSVLATPGHSAGSVTLLCGQTMFAGDTLFAGSCGRMDLEGGDEEAMRTSLARLGNLEGDFQVLPGHMDASTLERERAYNPYLRQAMGR